MTWYPLLALVAAAVGAVGGLGGAVLLVPALVMVGVAPSEAAPLGLMSVAAGSVAAAPRQLRDRSTNHRLGVATEVVASTGAVVGALLSGMASERLLTLSLAAVALAAAFAGGRRTGLRNLPDPMWGPDDVGERIGSLGGAYPLGDDVVPYRVRRLPVGMALMGVAGLIAGTSGASGGFLKTPATSEVMHVPVRVAASTTTFTVGITSAAALLVFAVQGRLDPEVGAAVVAGSLIGGQIGAALQSRLHPARVRRILSGVLIVVSIALLVKA